MLPISGGSSCLTRSTHAWHATNQWISITTDYAEKYIHNATYFFGWTPLGAPSVTFLESRRRADDKLYLTCNAAT